MYIADDRSHFQLADQLSVGVKRAFTESSVSAREILSPLVDIDNIEAKRARLQANDS